MKKDRRIRYFAAEPTEEVAQAFYEKVTENADALRSRGYYEMLKKSYRAYYGIDQHGSFHAASRLSFEGQQGEFTKIKINEIRNLVQHVLVMTTSDRLAFEPQAANTSSKYLEQVTLARGILEYYLHNKRLESKLVAACEASLVFGEGFVTLEWDPNAGVLHSSDNETGRPVFSGDVVCKNIMCYDVFRDQNKQDNEWDWVIYRDWQNRFDLIASYPQFEEKILNLPSKREVLEEIGFDSDVVMGETDDVAVYYAYHRVSPALPRGRHVVFCDDELTLFDVDMPYKRIPVYRVAPADIMGGPFGYTTVFDGLAIQEALDALYSIILSNQSASGVQLFWMPEGAQIEHTALSEGLSVITTPPGMKPEALQLTSSPPEVFEYIQVLSKKLEMLFGVSSVSRGAPENSLKSGSALALVQAMSIQFNSGFQKSVVKLQEDVGTGLLQILQSYANTPQILMLAGPNEQSFVKSFVGEDLQGIDGVIVRVGSPLSQTTAGRIEMARDMMTNQLVKNPQEYMQVLNSGRLEPIIEGPLGRDMLVRRENEELLQGNNPPVMPTDIHPEHIIKNSEVLNTPEARRDPKIRDAAIAHMQAHIDQWKQMSVENPHLLLALGMQPIAPMPGAEPGAEEEGGVARPQQIEGGAPAIPGDAAAPTAQPSSAGASMPNMPRAPKNPLTGEEADIEIPE